MLLPRRFPFSESPAHVAPLPSERRRLAELPLGPNPLIPSLRPRPVWSSTCVHVLSAQTSVPRFPLPSSSPNANGQIPFFFSIHIFRFLVFLFLRLHSRRDGGAEGGRHPALCCLPNVPNVTNVADFDAGRCTARCGSDPLWPIPSSIIIHHPINPTIHHPRNVDITHHPVNVDITHAQAQAQDYSSVSNSQQQSAEKRTSHEDMKTRCYGHNTNIRTHDATDANTNARSAGASFGHSA